MIFSNSPLNFLLKDKVDPSNCKGRPASSIEINLFKTKIHQLLILHRLIMVCGEKILIKN